MAGVGGGGRPAPPGYEVNPGAKKYGKTFKTSSGKMATLNPYRAKSAPPTPAMGRSSPFGGGGGSSVVGRGGVRAPGRPTAPPAPRGGGGGGGRGGGGGGGGPRPPGPTFNFQELQQNLKPNVFQTGAYEKMEDLYENVPDYYTRALAQSRAAGSQGLEAELAGMGGRGFGPGSGFTGRALADYGRGISQDIMGGQMDAAQKTFANKMGLAGAMGGLGSNIAGNLATMYGQNIGAYNAMANYALGNERNQINWYDAQARAQQGMMNPMVSMMNSMMQSGMAFL